jgi:dihydropteroate synthase
MELSFIPFSFMKPGIATPQFWQTSRRKIEFRRPLVMGILNVTPDSFSDGGQAFNLNDALRRAEEIVSGGADIIDVGGESTRPGSDWVQAHEEIRRIIPVIQGIARRFDVPISIDTTKYEVAVAAVGAGAEIINDISGLRFDERIADAASNYGAGLILMHSRGDFATMHSQQPVIDIMATVSEDFHRSLAFAESRGVRIEQIVLDPGIGFGKTSEQNLELIAKLDRLKFKFSAFPFLIGASRKSVIGKLLGDVPAGDRTFGSVAAAVASVLKGADIVRVHDVRPTVEALAVVRGIIEKV